MAVAPSQLVSTVFEKLIVKPSFPTPFPLKYHKLSFIDQSLSHLYIPLVFFFSKQQEEVNNKISGIHDVDQVAHRLQNSLATTLSAYYPYAGSMRDSAMIECNDRGIEFLNVQIKCPMSEMLNNPHDYAEGNIFMKDLPWKNSFHGSLLVAQLSHFDCGGIAISVCLSHKVGDGGSMASFFYDWAKVTRNPNQIPRPKFIGDTFFPTPNGPLMAPLIDSKLAKCVHKKFHFSASKLQALRAIIAAEAGIKNPTRAEVVSAILFKSATKAASKINNTSFRPSKLINYVDIRPITTPPLSRNFIGNLITVTSTSASHDEEMKLPRLVREVRKEFELLFKNDPVQHNLLVLKLLETMESPNAEDEFDTYYCSNMCKFSERVCAPMGPFKNFFILSADRSMDGIEAMVTLEEQHMLAFECDEELLEYASPISRF
ncbi:unnamed protein product [Withania somnifera]